MSERLKTARKHLSVVASASVLQSPQQYIEHRRNALTLLKNRAIASQSTLLHRKKQHFIALTAKLDAMSPLKVLTRGYAMLQDEQGSVIRSIHQAENGNTVRAIISDGVLTATIIGVEESNYE